MEKEKTKGKCPACGGKLIRKEKPKPNRSYETVVYYRCIGCSKTYYEGKKE